MNSFGHDDLLEAILKTGEFDRRESTSDVSKNDLTFKRDEDGILWSYDTKTGKKVGRIFEHGDD